jgi:hypothetical protein
MARKKQRRGLDEVEECKRNAYVGDASPELFTLSLLRQGAKTRKPAHMHTDRVPPHLREHHTIQFASHILYRCLADVIQVL